MKSTFSRTFTAAAAILVLTLLTLGASFQALVKEYLEDTTISGLKNDARVIADLAAAYSMDGSLSGQEFLLNLDVASRVSDADAVICDARGRVILCSDALLGCEHQGLSVNRSYLEKVLQNNGDTAVGMIQGLYGDTRYVVSVPILNESGTTVSGIVILSIPIASTDSILQRIFRLFVSASIIVVIVAVAATSLFARHQSRPLKDLALAANAFGHGDLDARVRITGSESREVEELYAEGESFRLRGYGVLHISADCDEEKLKAVVKSVSIRGKMFAPDWVKQHYGVK